MKKSMLKGDNVNKIGVFDSGIGGLTILNKLVEVLPNEDFLYFGDSSNCPYGDKSLDDLLKIVSRIVDFFKSQGCKLIVIACNTATTRCMKILRKMYPDLIFVGTVPAIKMACDRNYKNILVLATAGTINSDRVKELVIDNKKENQNIYLVGCPKLADAIESKNDELIDNILNKNIKLYVNKNIDSIVLGCTHYPWAINNIKKIFPNADYFDSSYGVSKEVRKQLEFNNLLNNDSNYIGSVKIIENI